MCIRDRHFRGLTFKEKTGKRIKHGQGEEKKKNKRNESGDGKKKGKRDDVPIHFSGYATAKKGEGNEKGENGKKRKK